MRTFNEQFWGSSASAIRIEAAAFEMNVIYSVTYYDRIDAGFRYLNKHHGGMFERLGFRAA